jgi:hypothetical protein
MNSHRLHAAVLALLAAAFFVATPFLLGSHHHSDWGEDFHCALCLLASAQVSPAAAQFEPAPAPEPVARAETPSDTIFLRPRTHPHQGRAPPAA